MNALLDIRELATNDELIDKVASCLVVRSSDDVRLRCRKLVHDVADRLREYLESTDSGEISEAVLRSIQESRLKFVLAFERFRGIYLSIQSEHRQQFYNPLLDFYCSSVVNPVVAEDESSISVATPTTPLFKSYVVKNLGNFCWDKRTPESVNPEVAAFRRTYRFDTIYQLRRDFGGMTELPRDRNSVTPWWHTVHNDFLSDIGEISDGRIKALNDGDKAPYTSEHEPIDIRDIL